MRMLFLSLIFTKFSLIIRFFGPPIKYIVVIADERVMTTFSQPNYIYMLSTFISLPLRIPASETRESKSVLRKHSYNVGEHFLAEEHYLADIWSVNVLYIILSQEFCVVDEPLYIKSFFIEYNLTTCTPSPVSL